jgi:hypothetical protein
MLGLRDRPASAGLRLSRGRGRGVSLLHLRLAGGGLCQRLGHTARVDDAAVWSPRRVLRMDSPAAHHANRESGRVLVVPQRMGFLCHAAEDTPSVLTPLAAPGSPLRWFRLPFSISRTARRATGLSRVALHMLQRLGEPLRVEDVPQLGVERERHAQHLVPLSDQPLRVGDEAAADGNQSPQAERPFRHTRRESSRYAIQALNAYQAARQHRCQRERAVTAHSWLPPQLWRYPRCCAII